MLVNELKKISKINDQFCFVKIVSQEIIDDTIVKVGFLCDSFAETRYAFIYNKYIINNSFVVMYLREYEPGDICVAVSIVRSDNEYDIENVFWILREDVILQSDLDLIEKRFDHVKQEGSDCLLSVVSMITGKTKKHFLDKNKFDSNSLNIWQAQMLLATEGVFFVNSFQKENVFLDSNVFSFISSSYVSMFNPCVLIEKKENSDSFHAMLWTGLYIYDPALTLEQTKQKTFSDYNIILVSPLVFVDKQNYGDYELTLKSKIRLFFYRVKSLVKNIFRR